MRATQQWMRLRMQQSRFSVAITVARPGASTGIGQFDPNTGTYTTDPDSAVWSGRAAFSAGRAREQEIGQAVATVRQQAFEVPVTAETGQIRAGDEITVDESDDDPAATGTTWVVTDVTFGQGMVTRTLRVEQKRGT